MLINNQKCDLTLSYPGTLSEETNKHGHEFAKSFLFKHTPNFIDKEQFLLDRQNNNNNAIYQIYPYTVSQAFLAYKLHSETEEFLPIEVIHLSSVVLCFSNQ